MLNERVEAETTYAMRLDRLANQSASKPFALGSLADEIQSFKDSCQARANAAVEVAENVAESCI